jgi:hypothetical protein
VTAGQLGANLKGRFRQSGFHPQAALPVLLKSLMVAIGFASRKRIPKNVLFDGMGPLGHMEGRQPHDRSESHTVLGLG